jgi:hypothetical protein
VAVYCHKDIGLYLRGLAGQRVHAPDRITIVEVDRRFADAVAAKLERRNALAISVTEGQLYVDMGGESFSTALVRHAWPG